MGMAGHIAIVGPGVVGTTLGVLAQRSGYKVALVARDRVKAEVAAEYFDQPPLIQNLGDDLLAADIVLLTVPDDQIAAVAEHIAPHIKPQTIVAHCSGALTSAELRACAERGAITASVHPLQTFPSVSSALANVAGTACYYEWDKSSAVALKPLLQALNMQAVEISAESKTLYHAAAVMACNYLTALMDAALETGEKAGIERDTLWASLKPLIDATLSNIDATGPAKALTGPIARGDIQTVAKQIAALEKVDGQLMAYKALGLQALALAEPNLPKDSAEQIRRLLQPS